MEPRPRAGFCVYGFRTLLVLPSESDVLEFIGAHSSVLVRSRKYPRWNQDEIMSELFMLWAELCEKYGEQMDGRWRGLLKTAGSRRLPDRYQKSLGMKIRRNPKEGMKRRYVSDADLLGAEIKTEYRPEEPLWSAEQMQKARTLLEIAAGSERLQKALRDNGYRGPFPRVD